MKVKAILATLVGVLAINAHAGTGWSSSGKSGKVTYTEQSHSCDKCEDIGGSVTVGYDTDYVWKGVRFAGDNVWADVNYTFENLPFSPNIGVWHLSSLGSFGGDPTNLNDFGTDNYGDETNFYASINLPDILGASAELGYILIALPNQRGPSDVTANNGGDSLSRVYLSLDKSLTSNINATWLSEYYFGSSDVSAWFHTLGLYTSIPVFKCTSLDLSADVSYSDNFHGGKSGRSGFNHYNIKASLPVTLNNRTTLTPYISYNGTPDAWVADEFNPGTFGPRVSPNFNDVFYGGVSLSVDF